MFDFGIENNDKDSEFIVGDHVRISKYKNIFANITFQIGAKRLL